MKKKKLKLKRKFKFILNSLLIILFLFVIKGMNNENSTFTKPILNENELIYLALNDKYKINYNYQNIEWISSDNETAIVDNGIVTPLKNGVVTIVDCVDPQDTTVFKIEGFICVYHPNSPIWTNRRH